MERKGYYTECRRAGRAHDGSARPRQVTHQQSEADSSLGLQLTFEKSSYLLNDTAFFFYHSGVKGGKKGREFREQQGEALRTEESANQVLFGLLVPYLTHHVCIEEASKRQVASTIPHYGSFLAHER